MVGNPTKPRSSAFEVTIAGTDTVLFSKFDKGRFPAPGEVEKAFAAATGAKAPAAPAAASPAAAGTQQGGWSMQRIAVLSLIILAYVGFKYYLYQKNKAEAGSE